MLVRQIFDSQPGARRKVLVIFSDMRQSTPELDLEPMVSVPSFAMLAPRCGPLPSLHGITVHVLGADGAGKSVDYWQSLQEFWMEYPLTILRR